MSVNVNEKDNDGMTALMHACESHDCLRMLSLIEAGANVNEKDNDGKTSLMHAAKIESNRTENISSYLIKAGANVNEKDNDGMTALMHFANSHYDIDSTVEQFIHAGARATVNSKNNRGWTALMMATRTGAKSIRRLFCERRGDWENTKTKNGRNLLMIAAKGGSSDLVLDLIEQFGFDKVVDEKDKDGWTALMLATKEGHNQTVKYLIEAGASVDEKDNDGWTALMIAARYGHKINMDEWTALMRAARYSYSDAAKYLIEAGANVHHKDIGLSR